MSVPDIRLDLEETNYKPSLSAFPSSSSSTSSSSLNPRPRDHANRKRSNSQSQVVSQPSTTRTNTSKSNKYSLRDSDTSYLNKRSLNEYIITLTPLNDTFIEKRLHIPHSPEHLELGRPTGSKVKPDVTNGYFDSRVLSRKHASMYYDPALDKIMIKDLNSSNGTFVNDEKLGTEPVSVEEGDTINLGFYIQQESNHKQISAKVKNISIMANFLKTTNGTNSNNKGINKHSNGSAKINGALSALDKLQNSDSYDFKHLNFIQDIFTHLPDQSAFPNQDASPNRKQKGLRSTKRKNKKPIDGINDQLSFDSALFSDINPNVEETLLGLSNRGSTGIFNNSQITNPTNLDSIFGLLILNLSKVKQQNTTLKTLDQFIKNYQSKLNELNSSYISKEVDRRISKVREQVESEKMISNKLRYKNEELEKTHTAHSEKHKIQLEKLNEENEKLRKSLADELAKAEELAKAKASELHNTDPINDKKIIVDSGDTGLDAAKQHSDSHRSVSRRFTEPPITSPSTTSTSNIHVTASKSNGSNGTASGDNGTYNNNNSNNFTTHFNDQNFIDPNNNSYTTNESNDITNGIQSPYNSNNSTKNNNDNQKESINALPNTIDTTNNKVKKGVSRKPPTSDINNVEVINNDIQNSSNKIINPNKNKREYNKPRILNANKNGFNHSQDGSHSKELNGKENSMDSLLEVLTRADQSHDQSNSVTANTLGSNRNTSRFNDNDVQQSELTPPSSDDESTSNNKVHDDDLVFNTEDVKDSSLITPDSDEKNSRDEKQTQFNSNPSIGQIQELQMLSTNNRSMVFMGLSVVLIGFLYQRMTG